MLGAEDGAVKVFVQVGTANTAPCDLDQNLARSGFGCGDVFNADVVTVVEACCFMGWSSLAWLWRSQRCVLAGTVRIHGSVTVSTEAQTTWFGPVVNCPAGIRIASAGW